MNNQHLRDRTNQILEEKIAWGMTGGGGNICEACQGSGVMLGGSKKRPVKRSTKRAGVMLGGSKKRPTKKAGVLLGGSKKKSNEWQKFLAEYRKQNKHLPEYQGFQGSGALMRDAGELYRGYR